MQCTFLPRNYLFFVLLFFLLIKETRSIAQLIPLGLSEIIQSSYLDVMKFHVHRRADMENHHHNCPASVQPDSITPFPFNVCPNVTYFKELVWVVGLYLIGYVYLGRQLLVGKHLISGLLVWKVPVKVMNKKRMQMRPWMGHFGFVMIITAAVDQSEEVLCPAQLESKTHIMQTNCLCPKSVP